MLSLDRMQFIDDTLCVNHGSRSSSVVSVCENNSELSNRGEGGWPRVHFVLVWAEFASWIMHLGSGDTPSGARCELRCAWKLWHSLPWMKSTSPLPFFPCYHSILILSWHWSKKYICLPDSFWESASSMRSSSTRHTGVIFPDLIRSRTYPDTVTSVTSDKKKTLTSHCLAFSSIQSLRS